MKVLLVHNFYQKPGGEDQVFAAEGALLESHGHSVIRYTVHNDEIGAFNGLQLAKTAIWNSGAHQSLKKLLRVERPDIMHVHNTFPLISPAIYHAAKSTHTPVVQTLHNYRLFCPNAYFFRDGAICEDCLGKFVAWPGVVHSCYRESRSATGVVALMLSAHRLLGTWENKVDKYIALTEFSRQKFLQGGLPKQKVVVKPNFMDPDPGIGQGDGKYAIFVGRLSPEKGVETLLEAWGKLKGRIRLKIVGDGPMASRVTQATQHIPNIQYLGHLSRIELFPQLKNASFLIFPSQWYEGFPMTITEAFATGLPVIGSDVGSISGLIEHGVTGLRFQSGNSQDLAKQVEWLIEHPTELTSMRSNARKEFEHKYTANQNYALLMNIYGQVRNKYQASSLTK